DGHRAAESRCFGAAISGPIPPYFSWAATCDATSLASNSWPERSPRKIATAVSSQEVSRANTVISSEVETSLERTLRAAHQKKIRDFDFAQPLAFPSMSRLPEPLHSRLRSE